MPRTEEETKNKRRWLLLRGKVFEQNIVDAFRLFRSEGIEPILIKGWAAAREYPPDNPRIFGDIDLSVAPEDFERGLRLLTREDAVRLNIDLHKGLRHLDTVSWKKLFENSRVVQIGVVPVRILRPEDHLRVLCVHWLTDGGAYRERLLDIRYLLENNGNDFDWDYCFGSISENRRDWIIKTICLAEKYYGLNLPGLPFAIDWQSIPKWFLKALEREWASPTRLVNIYTVLRNRKDLVEQLKKRLRPNPIQATVFMEGKFNNAPRLYYQVGSFFKRLRLSVGRLGLILTDRRSKDLGKNG